MLKNNISDVYSHKYMKNLINSHDHLPLEKTMNMYNEVMLFKTVFNKNYNHYYYEKFLEKCSYKQYIKCYITI